jgi:hypothetical protein
VYNTLTLAGYTNATFNATAFAFGVAAAVGVPPSSVVVHGVVSVGASSSVAGRRLHQSTTSKVSVSFSIQTTTPSTVASGLSAAIFNDSLQTALVSAGLTQLAGTIVLGAAPATTVVLPAAVAGQATQCPFCAPPPSPPPPPSPSPPPPMEDARRRMEVGLAVGLGLGVPVVAVLVFCSCRWVKGRRGSAGGGRRSPPIPSFADQPVEAKAAAPADERTV